MLRQRCCLGIDGQRKIVAALVSEYRRRYSRRGRRLDHGLHEHRNIFSADGGKVAGQDNRHGMASLAKCSGHCSQGAFTRPAVGDMLGIGGGRGAFQPRISPTDDEALRGLSQCGQGTGYQPPTRHLDERLVGAHSPALTSGEHCTSEFSGDLYPP